MRILLLNQAFFPDVAATGQYLTDLSLELVAAGHQVTVVTSRRAYDDAHKQYPARENWRGIDVIRIGILGLGKGARWRRAADFASFLLNCALRAFLLPRFDLVIALTSPPLISALGALLVHIKGGRFVFWVMDLNPDEAVAAGWIRRESLLCRLLSAFLNYSLRHSHAVIALDEFMGRLLISKGVPQDRVLVIPPWSHDEHIAYDPRGRDAFRREYGLQEKFVVMYAGNHSPCHPLDSLLSAAERLRDNPAIAFCFIGGGSEYPRVKEFGQSRGLQNIICLPYCSPYDPGNRLSAALSSADLQVVVMGDPFVGIVHPCKVYNIRRIGTPFVYVGPQPSHVTALGPAAAFRHGDVSGLVQFLSSAALNPKPLSPDSTGAFSQHTLVSRLVDEIQGVLEEAPLALTKS